MISFFIKVSQACKTRCAISPAQIVSGVFDGIQCDFEGSQIPRMGDIDRVLMKKIANLMRPGIIFGYF
ncbi:hypothetical protein TMES_02820 [Thalassospira mesophila]|uniref:Uncharacterized protein n=1 Tax=Thalassospira mesophila TaxID=1293891 RepID=A0A1Y2L550_9PROT|nr:hypothetical protein TMES_02820 [Thalassospira mesophila]